MPARDRRHTHGEIIVRFGQDTPSVRRTLATVAASVALVLGLSSVGSVPASAATPAPRPLVTGWLPYWNTAAGLASVTANADLFGDVSPFWYSARGKAPSVTIASQAGGISIPSVVSALHAKHVKVLPTITDGTGSHQMARQLSTSTGRARVVNAIVGVVVAHGYDGIDLDWEGFAFNDGQSTWTTTRVYWVAFVKSLYVALHRRGRMLAITVPGGLGTSSDSTGYWVYAWSQIGPYLDRLRVMAYDYSVSRPGPIAPFSWVDKVAAHAVTQVASTKVQIGIASYGRDWYTGVTGRCPNISLSSATSSAFFSKLSWAKARHEFDARGAASYVSNLFVSAAATVPGISRVQVPVATWDSTAKERTFSYQLGFSGRYQAPTATFAAAGGVAGETSVVVASSTGVAVGDAVSGTGVAAGAHVTAVSANVLTLSVPNAATVTGTLTVTGVSTVVATGAAGSSSLLLSGSPRVSVGSAVVGAGVAAGTVVTAVSVDTSSGSPVVSVTLSKPLTIDVAGAVTFTTVRALAAVGGVTGGTSIRAVSTSGVLVGAVLTGTGVPSGAKVTAVAPHAVTLATPLTGSVTGSVTATPVAVASSCTIARTGWYADASSAVAGATLVGKYHLRGIAEWTIGGEDTRQWSGLRTYARSVAQVPTTVALAAPRSLYTGRRGTVRVGVVSRGAPVANTTVVLLWRPATSATWVRKGTAVTNASGRLAFTTPPATATGYWRAVVGETWARYAGNAVSAAPTVVRRAPTTVGLKATSRIKRGSVARATAHVTSLGAVVARAVVTFFWRSSPTARWAVVGTAVTDAAGNAVRGYKPKKSGYWRAVVSGTWARLPVATTAKVVTVVS